MATSTINIAIVTDDTGEQFLVFAENKRNKNFDGKMVDNLNFYNTFFKPVNGGKKSKLRANLPANLFTDREYFADMFANVVEWFLPEPEVFEEIEEIDIDEEEEVFVNDKQIEMAF